MGFSTQTRKHERTRPWKINPIWRGIGCILIILIPIMAWFAAQLFTQTNTRVPIPTDLTKVVTIRLVHNVQIDRVIADINRYTAAHNLTTGQFFFTFILMFAGFGILSVLYAIMYRIAGPPRYGPFDVPPNKVRR
ncbi:MAG TPA: hypothetical protein VF831_01210 [Anaerolineales bacterium]